MEKDFQWAIRPLTVTAAILGFALIEYPEGKPRRHLSLLCAIVSVSSQVAMLSTKSIYFDIQDAIILSSIRFNIRVYLGIHILVLACLSQLHGKRYQQCLEAINEIDETLRRLGIETDYSRLRRPVVVTLAAWITWIFMINAFDTLALSKEMNPIYVTITIIILLIPVHAPIIVDMRFWFVVRYAGTRFDSINSALRELALDDKDYIGWVRNKKVTSIRVVSILNEKNQRIIWAMMHLHFRLCKILCDITRLFETQLYMEIGYSFLYVLHGVIFMFRLMLLPFEANKYKYCALIWMWSFLHILKIFVTNYICENVHAKAMAVSATAVRLICNMDDEKMRQDLLLIVLQTKYKPLRFSCLGLTYFGYQFLYTIVSTMATVTVIILQLKTGLQ